MPPLIQYNFKKPALIRCCKTTCCHHPVGVPPLNHHGITMESPEAKAADQHCTFVQPAGKAMFTHSSVYLSCARIFFFPKTSPTPPSTLASSLSASPSLVMADSLSWVICIPAWGAALPAYLTTSNQKHKTVKKMNVCHKLLRTV